MPDNRERLKLDIVRRLDEVCSTHPMGHQASKARRYIYTNNAHARFELMFEQNPSVPANLWVLESAVSSILDKDLAFRRSPSDRLYVRTGKNGDRLYGRHSSMEKMPQLGKADLVCFNIRSMTQLKRILDALDSES